MPIATQSRGFLTLLRKRNFLLLWLAQLISQTTFFATNYALLILIENITHSATMVGVAIICFSVPAVLFGAPAGVFVDRMDKRCVLWSTNLLRAITTFIFVIILFFDRHLLLVPIYLLTFLISAISQFFAPAEGSTIPLLVDKEELMPALSLFNITFMLSQAVGYILLAPLALSFIPTITLSSLTIDAVALLHISCALLYLICAGLTALIPRASFVPLAPTKSLYGPVTTETLGMLGNVWNEMLQGWSFVRQNKLLFLAVVQLSFAGILLLLIGQLAMPIVTQLLQLPATVMAFVFAPAGIGLVLGSVFMPRISNRLGKSHTIIIGLLALTTITLAIPLTIMLARFISAQNWNTNPLLLTVMALFMFAAGVSLDFINIPAQTSIQELTPDWIKGRVLALQLALYNACSIPIIPFFGAISDFFGISSALYLLSICAVTFGLWGIYYQRKHPSSLSTGSATGLQELDKIGARSPRRI
jgi:MFS family permease